MARYQCRACGFDGLAPWSGKPVCPGCGDRAKVRVVLPAQDRAEVDLSAVATGRYGSADWGEEA